MKICESICDTFQGALQCSVLSVKSSHAALAAVFEPQCYCFSFDMVDTKQYVRTSEKSFAFHRIRGNVMLVATNCTH